MTCIYFQRGACQNPTTCNRGKKTPDGGCKLLGELEFDLLAVRPDRVYTTEIVSAETKEKDKRRKG